MSCFCPEGRRLDGHDPADMQRFAESGVDGIISDDAALLCRTLS